MLTLPKEIRDKYKSYIIKYNSGEDIIHYTVLKEVVHDLLQGGYGIHSLDGFFHISGKYTMCPINLIRELPQNYLKNTDDLYNFIDTYIEIAKQDAKEDKNSMNDFYVEIYYTF